MAHPNVLKKNWLIRNTATGMYWSNLIRGGWTTRDLADLFTSIDVGRSSLPMDGIWESVQA